MPETNILFDYVNQFLNISVSRATYCVSLLRRITCGDDKCIQNVRRKCQRYCLIHNIPDKYSDTTIQNQFKRRTLSGCFEIIALFSDHTSI